MDGAGPTWLWSVTCIRSQAHNSQGVACLLAQETQRQAGGQAGRGCWKNSGQHNRKRSLVCTSEVSTWGSPGAVRAGRSIGREHGSAVTCESQGWWNWQG